MATPHYAVRHVKTFRGMEGTGVNARLYRDGRCVALVIDDATGGETRFAWVDEATRDRGTLTTPEERRLVDFCRTLPKTKVDADEIETTPAIYVDDLVAAALYEKAVKRSLATRTLVRLADGRILEFKAKPNDAVRASIAKRYGGVTVLNDLPVQEAVAACRAAGL